MEKLLEDMKKAMKEKDTLRLSVIRMVKGDLDKIRIDQKREVEESDFYTVLEKQIKMREDSIESFKKAGRDDLKEQTEEEIKVLKEYLPEPLSDEEVMEILEASFEEIQPESIKDMGKVMNHVTPLVKGRYDMKKISSMIKEKLQ